MLKTRIAKILKQFLCLHTVKGYDPTSTIQYLSYHGLFFYRVLYQITYNTTHSIWTYLWSEKYIDIIMSTTNICNDRILYCTLCNSLDDTKFPLICRKCVREWRSWPVMLDRVAEWVLAGFDTKRLYLLVPKWVFSILGKKVSSRAW